MIVNFGSINADLVYRVHHMPHPGETLLADGHSKHLGGKGLNQSVAIKRSGGDLRHVGCVGAGDTWISQQLLAAGMNLDHIAQTAEPTGHAIIYVDRNSENEIVIFSGANQCHTMDMVEVALKGLNGPDHWALFQNETNLTMEIAHLAKERGFKIAYSAAPFVAQTALALLPLTDLLVVNEQEAEEMAKALNGGIADIDVPMLLVTYGARGSELRMDGIIYRQAAFQVRAVDTTGAGDTFLGAFLAQYEAGTDVASALRYASGASALQVMQLGAADAIPQQAEVKEFLEAQSK